jgi:hypothetical protein
LCNEIKKERSFFVLSLTFRNFAAQNTLIDKVMIAVDSLRVKFGVKPLFADASFVVNDRAQRIGR